MIKRRKNKGNKFTRMNEEERARYMQHRSEVELEMKRRKQQLIAIFTKNKLKREEAFSKLNDAKINEKWRYILRQLKCMELCENVKHVSETFERTIKIKNETISCLYKELQVADADHRKLQESHMILIDNIIGTYKKKLETLYNVYNLSNITCNSIAELNKLKNFMEQNYKEMYNNIAKNINSLNEKQSAARIQNTMNILNVQHLERNIKSDLMHHSFSKIGHLWRELLNVINKYEEKTRNKKEQYEYVKQQDSIHQISILQYPKKCLELQNIIENLKYHIEISLLKRNNQIAKLKTKNGDIYNKFKNIKHNIVVMQAIDSSQMKKLVVISNDVLKHLQKMMAKCSMILEILKICSTLKPASFNIKNYFVQDAIYTEPIHTTIPKSYNKINNFLEQHNYITVDNILLKKERDKLHAENERLIHELQTYITTVSGISVSRPVVSSLF